jgi:hypothetical protein
MQSKLTLRLEEQLIHRAKDYARHSGRSVSQLVADYFALLESPSATESTSEEDRLPPLTLSLYGVLADTGVDEADYGRYLEEKHR